jgi:hypothetical protein
MQGLRDRSVRRTLDGNRAAVGGSDVTELTQPRSAADAASLPETATEAERPPPSHAPTFPELVYAHFAWWKRGQARTGSETPVAHRYRDVLERFEQRYGPIVDSYWCSHVESAVALTERKRALPWVTPELTFHRETDWATKSHPEIASQLHRCDEIAVRATSVLRGMRRRICLQLVMTSASHLLSLVDARAAHEDDEKAAQSLAQERDLLAQATSYYHEAANGQAQIVYFAGMTLVASVVAIGAGLWLALSWASPLAALLAGAVGAVVSVIQRITAGHFDLRYDVGRGYALFLGGLRPLIGGAFALAVTFAFMSGLLHLPLSEHDRRAHERLALLVIGFVAGFSERWAQDTLATALPAADPPPNDPLLSDDRPAKPTG